MLVAISHHPVAQGRPGVEALQAVVQLGTKDRFVHGSLIAIIFAMIFSFTVYTLGRSRLSLCVAAWVAFFAGSIGVIGAMLIDGFFVPGFAEHYLRTTPIDAAPGLAILNAAAVTIQILTKFGFVALNVAALLWSIDLLLERGQVRIVGVIGVIASLTSMCLVIFGGTINVHSLLVIVGIQALWYFAIAWRMISRQR